MHRKTSTLLLCTCLTLALANTMQAQVLASEKSVRPNVVFIFVDDQGYYDLGCYGGKEFDTPRIDRMASEGVRLTDYYAAAPICSPSRAGLLTGCYPTRIGMATWVHRADSRSGIHPNELTLGELFQANGYATACIGKWHLGFKPPFLPRQQGFDHYFGLLHNLDPVEIVYFEGKGGVPLLRNGEVVKRPADPAELTRLYTDEAIHFMEQKRDKPFFIYLPHTMLHIPLGVGKEFVGKSKMGEYGDATMELDHHVGRIFDSLKRLQLEKNTIVIYASDNGRGPGRNAEQPIRGRKLTTYEGGLRVPCIAWGPGVGIQAKQTSGEVINAMDWYPTLATFAGIRVPAGRVIDGRDISPLLTGKTNKVPSPSKKLSLNATVPLRRPWNPNYEWGQVVSRDEYLRAFFYHGSQGALAAVRLDNHKYYLNPQPTLYDLSTDPGESRPIRSKMIRKMRGLVSLFQDEMQHGRRPAGLVAPSNPPSNRTSTQGAVARTSIPKAMRNRLESYAGVTYARYDDRLMQMDLFRPKNASGKLPAIVCIHGGGWAKGDRSSHATLAMALADRGFVTATISYRLSGEAPFPAAIHDCKAAVRFLRANAKTYGIHADRIGAIGLSAGGHLTALLGTSSGVKELEGSGGNAQTSSAIQAAVPMGAQTDLESQRTRDVSSSEKKGKIWQQFLGGTQEENFKTYQQASPLFHLDASDPPIAMMTGANDDPSTHGTKFRAKMKSLGLASHLKVIADAPHPFLGKQVWFDQCVDYAASFFTVHLKDSP